MKRGDLFCAPICSKYENIPTQVVVGIDEGLKQDSAVYCDDLISLPKYMLTNYIGSLPAAKIDEINTALRLALAIE